MASCIKVIASSDSSSSHAAEAIRHKEGSSMGEPTILRSFGRSWSLLPIGSALAQIQSLSTSTSTPGAWPGRGPWRSSRPRERLTAWRLAGVPDW